MFFNRRNRIAERARQGAQMDREGKSDELYAVAYEQMLKGHIIKRGRENVRQCAVIIDGYMHLVTSGDCVTRSVYAALVEKGYLLAPGKSPDSKELPPAPNAADPRARG